MAEAESKIIGCYGLAAAGSFMTFHLYEDIEPLAIERVELLRKKIAEPDRNIAATIIAASLNSIDQGALYGHLVSALIGQRYFIATVEPDGVTFEEFTEGSHDDLVEEIGQRIHAMSLAAYEARRATKAA